VNPVSEDIKDILCDSSIAIAIFGEDLFISAFPDAPDLCVCLVDTRAWRSPEVNYALFYPSFQVLVRGTPSGYLTAWNKIENIRDELHRRTNFTLNGIKYKSISASTDIEFIGRDEKNRPIFSCNFNVMR